jgi:hypothetical protein
MADVVLCYASEDAAVAGRLAAAVAGQGYTVWSEKDLEGSRADITDRISQARAAIVIWSEAAAASEWVRAEANFARGQKKLIQASADDRPPPLPFRPAEIVSIADWQGDDAHPGWRRIKAGLEDLCGPAGAGKAAALGPGQATASPSHEPGSARRRRSTGLLAGLTLALLAAVAIATSLWMRDLAPVARQAQPPSVVAPDRPVTPAPAVEPNTAAPPAVSPPEDASPAEPASSGAERPTDSAGAPSSRGTVEAPPPRSKAEAPPPPPTGPRISRENSENMRLFCQRAGRGTPQCRIFARQLRNARR